MIKLRNRSLSKRSLNYLANRQKVINDKVTYAERVTEAKSKWNNFNNATFREVKAELIAMCPNPKSKRCMYCEDNIADEIEHFKPKDLYPELTFAWENYLLACGVCNGSNKNNKFAIFDFNGDILDITRKKNDEVKAPSHGIAVLINPRYEDPLDFMRINFLDKFFLEPKRNLSPKDKRRAKYTIETLNLNRSELTHNREVAFASYVDWLWSYKYHKEAGETSRLIEHETALHYKAHGMVWELLRRFYIERNPIHWETTLKAKYPSVADLDELFTAIPEVLGIDYLQ